MARLILESGKEPQEYTLGDLTRLGREPGNEIVVNDGGASRRHAEVARDGDGFVLKDLKSANGTYRNDERVDTVRLAEGDRIKIGAVVLRFTLESESASSGAGGAGGSAKETRFALVFTGGERAGDKLVIKEGRTTFGRKPGNTVTVKDPKVSGVHCEIVFEDGHPTLRDLGSTNGTYLEGKKVEEVPLSHGDRVLVGDLDFVFTDTTRPLPDALAKGPSVAAAQTLVDVPQVKVVKAVSGSRSPLAAIGLVLLLGGLGTAGFFLWKMRGESVGAEAPPAKPTNLLGGRWSLESSDGSDDPGSAFDLVAGTEGFREDGSTAKSGRQCLSASPAGSEAIAVLRSPVPVAAGRGVRIGGFLKASGGASAILSAVFTKTDDAEYVIPMRIGATSQSDWQSVSAEVTAPTGATHLAIELIAAGKEGKASFDDLEIEETSFNKVATITQSGFEFEAAGHVLFMRRGGQDLLRVMPTVFVGESGARHDATRYLAEAATRDAGRVLLWNGAASEFSHAFEGTPPTPSVRAEWKAPGAGVTVRIPIVLSPAIAEDAVHVMRGGTLEPFRDSFSSDEATGVVVGRGPNRLKIAIDPPCRINGTREGAVFRLNLEPTPTAGKAMLRFQVDFTEEKAQAQKLLADARAAEQGKKLGSALATLETIANSFPFDEAVLAEAEERTQAILKAREVIEKKVADAVSRARFLASPSAYAVAEAEAEAAAAAFDGTPAAKGFAEQRANLVQEREKVQRGFAEAEANLLFQQIETALAQDPPQKLKAKAIADYLAQRYPWSEAASKAAEKVGE